MPTRSSSSSSKQTQSPSGDRVELDLRGEICPYTFVRARLRLEKLPLGTELSILVDHEPATINIPRSATEWGQEVRAVEPIEDGLWRVVLQKRVD